MRYITSYYAERLNPPKATQIVANLRRPFDKGKIKITDPISYFRSIYTTAGLNNIASHYKEAVTDMSRRRGVFSVKSWCGDSWAGQAVCEFARNLRDVVDKAYKPEYKWVLRRKNRYGMDRWSKEKRDKQQGQIKGVEMPQGPRLDAPGTLHHVIIRGIERCKIVDNDTWQRRVCIRGD